MLKLRVRIMKARGLPATNFDGTCDTCCIVTLVHGGLESSDQTSVVKGTATPEWEHKSVFKDVAGATQLRIHTPSAHPRRYPSESPGAAHPYPRAQEQQGAARP